MTSIDRRAVLRGVAALGLGALVAACDRGQSPDGPPSRTSPAAQARSGSDPAPESTSESTAPERGGSVVLVSFSRPGENYWNGGRRDLSVGNTQVVAEQIAALLGIDVVRLEAADPYPHSYDETVERNRAEQEADARPEIAGGVPDLRGYDTIILGCPVWNTRAPMILRTLLDATDLTGTTIHPFITYAVGAGRVFADYAELYPDATVTTGLAIRGEEAAEAGAEIERWVTESGLAAQ